MLWALLLAAFYKTMRRFASPVIALLVLSLLITPTVAQDRSETIPLTPQNRAQFEHACDLYQDVPVRVTPVFQQPAYDYSQPIPVMQQISQHGSGIQEALTLGLTRYQEMMQINVQTESIKAPGIECSKVASADIRFGYDNVTVYIAREIPFNSCGFNQIMAHEQKHIAVNQMILQRYVPYIDREVRKYLKFNGLLRGADPQAAAALVKQHMQDIINQVMMQATNENRTDQKLVDSPEEYRRVSVSCNGQLQGIMNHYAQ